MRSSTLGTSLMMLGPSPNSAFRWRALLLAACRADNSWYNLRRRRCCGVTPMSFPPCMVASFHCIQIQT